MTAALGHGTHVDRIGASTATWAKRVAVVGAGIAGLSCARELARIGYHPVVFEASDRLGGRCSSLATRIGLFDDGAQCIDGPGRLAASVDQRPGELDVIHPWAVPSTPAEVRRHAGYVGRDDDDDEDGTVVLRSVGAVGVPSMRALADALARPLDVRRHTEIVQARRRGAGWRLRAAAGEIDEAFQALVLAIPAPLAAPLAQESCALAGALRGVRFRSRWVLLLGAERPVALPGYREFQGSPIERVAAMHRKPGRPAGLPERWFIEADGRWSAQHEDDDPEAVAELLLANFRAFAGRPVSPRYLHAMQWRHAFVETPAATPRRTEYLWDPGVRLGVCGDSVVASRVGRVHDSGVGAARAVAAALTVRRELDGVGASFAGRRWTMEARP